MAAPPNTAVIATAPLGGCKESVVIIRNIASPTATLKAVVKSGMYCAQATPIMAAKVLPTITFEAEPADWSTQQIRELRKLP